VFTSLFTIIATLPLELFARAGGGGSGGSGSGDGGGIFVFLGYIPMHAVGAVLYRFGKKSTGIRIAVNILGWIIAVIYAIVWTVIWRGFGLFVGMAALAGMAGGLYNLLSKLKQSKQTQADLAAASADDAAWSEEKLVEHAKRVFMQYQKDWSNLNIQAMQGYLTPHYYSHASLLAYTLKAMGRRDDMRDVKIQDAIILGVQNDTDDARDAFTIGITAQANDQLINTVTDQEIFTDRKPFTEYWTFQRSGSTWLLGGISQATADPYALNGQLRTFAQQHGYYYSLDMGWLFIPQRGQLFGEARFGVSDINNHIVGMYNNQMLVQLYSYVKNPQNSLKPYVIAQVNVPKQYGNIVVRRKKMLRMGIRGLEKVETEWTQFNDKYEVFASSAEQATSFELLNPTYMEQLEALPFEVSIEVVDNIIYLYTDELTATLEVYEAMLDLVNKAFKELRY